MKFLFPWDIAQPQQQIWAEDLKNFLQAFDQDRH